MPLSQMPVGGAKSLDQNTRHVGYTRADLPECAVSTMSGLPLETTRDRTQRTHTQSRTEIKIPDPTGNRRHAAGLEGRDSTDNAKFLTLNELSFFMCIIS